MVLCLNNFTLGNSQYISITFLAKKGALTLTPFSLAKLINLFGVSPINLHSISLAIVLNLTYYLTFCFKYKDRESIEHVNKHVIDKLLGFLLHGKSLIERPTLGRFVHINDLQRVISSSISIKKLQLIFRMGGVKAGKIIGETLIDSGLSKNLYVQFYR